jgi:tetratricopeptide (TPR) repeat protein
MSIKHFVWIAVLCLGLSTAAWAQKGKGQATQTNVPAPTQAAPVAPQLETTASNGNLDQIFETMYQHSVKYGDPSVALLTLYYQIAQNPNRADLKDSLASKYFMMGAYMQCITVGTEVLQGQPDNARMLEMLAISKRALNGIKESLDDYEKLYKLTKMPYHLYQIATLQYSLQRYGECNLSLTQIINDPTAKDEEVPIAVNEQQQQQVNLVAAAYNVLGVMLMEQSRKDEAKQAFTKAVELQADFVLAKNNLDMLNNPQKYQQGGQQQKPSGK